MRSLPGIDLGRLDFNLSGLFEHEAKHWVGSGREDHSSRHQESRLWSAAVRRKMQDRQQARAPP